MLHNEVLVPVGDFVAVFQPTFIWYSFVNVAARRRKKILSAQLFSLRILSGTSTMQKQFPLAFLFLSSQRSRKKIGREGNWRMVHKQQQGCLHCYEAHDLTYKPQKVDPK